MELTTAIDEALKRYERARKFKLDDALAKRAWEADIREILARSETPIPTPPLVEPKVTQPATKWMCVEELQVEMGVPAHFHTQGEQQAISRQVYRKIHGGPLAVHHRRQIYRTAGKKGSDRYHYSGPVLDLIREEIAKRMAHRMLTITGEPLQPTLDAKIFPTIVNLPTQLQVP